MRSKLWALYCRVQPPLVAFAHLLNGLVVRLIILKRAPTLPQSRRIFFFPRDTFSERKGAAAVLEPWGNLVWTPFYLPDSAVLRRWYK